MPDDAATSPAISLPDIALGDGAAAYETAVQRARDLVPPIGVLVGSQLSNTPAESGYQTTICVKRP